MEIQWEYDLPTDEESRDYHYESPIFVKDGKVYYLNYKVNDTPEWKYDLKLYIIDAANGSAEIVALPSSYKEIPCKFGIIDYQDKLILNTGELWLYDGDSATRFLQVPQQDKLGGNILYGNRLIFSYYRSAETWCCPIELWCCNLDTLEIEWKTDISNSKPYGCGKITIFESMIACNGKDALLFIDPCSGVITNQIKIPRIDKLYYPIRTEDGHLLLGYTNWTNAGILKYDMKQAKVIWRHKRKFEGPQSDCQLYRYENLIYWVKNDTELICLDADTGEEVFARRTTPWLYTDLRFVGDRILYGTAGANGYFNCIDAKSGAERCSVFLQNGCAFFDLHDDTVLVGDFSKTMMQISPDDGRILQKLSLDGEVVGDIRVCDGAVFTVIWGNEEKPIRLIKIKI